MCKEYIIASGKKYDKSHLTWVEGKGWEGVVYSYRLNAPGSEKDGWYYVGNTPEESTRKRMWQNPKNAYAGKKIENARKKFGLDNFDYCVHEKLYNEDLGKLVNTLEEREKYFIEKYDSEVSGFNGNKGGTGRLGVKISDEEIARRQASRGDFHHTEETKALISQKGLNRVVKQETKDKIRQSKKGEKRTAEQRKAQSDRMKGIEPKAATEGARRWREKNGGGSWKGKKIPPAGRANMKKAQQARGTDTIATWPDGHEETFPTMLDASKATGVAVGSIHYSITNNTKTKDGYKFRKAS